MIDIAELAKTVDEAARTATAIPQLTDSHADMTVEDAYAIQAAAIDRRLERGEKLIGIKMGLTSRAKMVQVGVDEVIWGRLTDKMLLEEGGTIQKSLYIHPRAEPEVAFLIGKPLAGNVTALEAMSAVEAVAPAIEIIDSRYQNFKFTLPDVVADNSSSSGVIVGDWFSPETRIENLGLILSDNGKPIQIGSTAAILGSPVRSLVAAAKLVARGGMVLEPGMIVLAGGATAAHPLAVGSTVQADFQTLGRVSISVVD